MTEQNELRQDIRAAILEFMPGVDGVADSRGIADAVLALVSERVATVEAERDEARASSDAYSERLSRQIEQSVLNETRLRQQLAGSEESRLAGEQKLASVQQQLSEREAVIEKVREMPDRREAVPIDDAARRHAYLKGYEDAVDDARALQGREL